MAIKKAGCFLINLENKTIAIVYRESKNDYSFPKGHVEGDEDLIEAAIRETAEETKRNAKVLTNIDPLLNKYSNTKEGDCECYLYFALDDGPSDNDSLDTHPTFWIPIDEVEDKLTYDNNKEIWRIAKEIIKGEIL